MGNRMATASTGPLAGLRVIDMTRVIAGPYAGQILGDLGGDVIKIERRGEGDDCRRVGPPWMKKPIPGIPGESTYFQAVNRNKRSLAADFAKPEGALLIRKLVMKADVLLENYRTGTLAKYGLGYEELRKIKPDLIYCSITGFGQTGPYGNRSGYDFLVQGMAGVMSITGLPDEEPGGGPMRVGIPLADISAGMNAVIGVLAALRHRDRTGEGQQIDISLFESQVAALLNGASSWFNGGEKFGRTGNEHPSASPYGVYKVEDGHIIIATFNDREFVRLATVLGHPEWITDSRFAKNGDRVANRLALKAEVIQALKGKTRAEWTQILNNATVSAGPINEICDLEHDPHILARKVLVTLEGSDLGPVRTIASPIRMGTTPVDYRRAPPSLGEHTEEILTGELGFDSTEIERLRGLQVI